MMYERPLLLTQAQNARTIQFESWPTRAQAAGAFKEGVACLELLLYVEHQKNIELYERGVFAHRRAVAVWGAFRGWRLHHNVSHVTGVISALFDHLKRQEVELNSGQQS